MEKIKQFKEQYKKYHLNIELLWIDENYRYTDESREILIELNLLDDNLVFPVLNQDQELVGVYLNIDLAIYDPMLRGEPKLTGYMSLDGVYQVSYKTKISGYGKYEGNVKLNKEGLIIQADEIIFDQKLDVL